MDKLIKAISEAKRAVIRIMNIRHHNELDIPVELDLEDMLDTFKYMSGYVDCMEKFGTRLKDE